MKSATATLQQVSTAGWWPAVRRIAVAGFMLGVLALIAWKAKDIDWPAVGRSLRDLPAWTLAAAAAFSALSYAIYGSFELLGWRCVGRPLPRRQMMAVAMSSYAVNLNLGTLVGGVGFRYRLYARLGLAMPDVAKLVGLSMWVNWLAYPILLGLGLVWPVVPWPADWALPPDTLRWAGLALWLLPIAYLGACAWAPRRSWTLRGQQLTLPSGRMALLQVGLSAANWLANAAAICVLMPKGVSYLAVLTALMVSAVAGVLAHVPGGLGVLEGVFVALLGGVAPAAELVGALLAYRALYYLGPLLLAALAYLRFETRMRRRTPG